MSFAAELDGSTLKALARLGKLEALTLKKAQKPSDEEPLALRRMGET